MGQVNISRLVREGFGARAMTALASAMQISGQREVAPAEADC